MNRVSLVGMINIIAIATIAAAAAAAAAVLDSQIALPGCPDHCGEVKVPYPFGTHKGCFLSKYFFIDCDESLEPPKPYLRNRTNNVQVSNITLEGGELVIMVSIGKDCYIKDGEQVYNFDPWLTLGGFNIATDRNKFTAVGCDTYATLQGYRGEREFITGCISSCDMIDSLNTDSCSGVGCCQTSIPIGLTNITVSVTSYDNHTYVYEFNPCSYAFVVEEGKFKFSNASFKELNNTESLPMVLNWAIGNDACNKAEKKRNEYACKGNSKCVNASNGSGYLCQCLEGYQGNPYHTDGCQDIDECNNTTSNPCGKNSICQNSPGNFTCFCEKGFNKVNENDYCSKVSPQRSLLFIYGSLVASITLVVAISLICWGMKKRKVNKLKKKFFEQNGGLTLQQQLYSNSSRRQSHETTQIFSAEELKKATNNYHESRVLGQGGYGIVYEGILPNNKVVAIKKSKFGAQKVNEQFINEVIMLLQINHRNVVKLLGCCLETEVPLLVYEFISNGTVFEHIHNKGQGHSPLSWGLRLKIATDTAGALAYLHSATSTPIIHRDVKTGNILLDEKFTAKVSDFGASRLIPLDQTQLSTVVQGTLGYLDPEYMHTSQLTEKSDVYSFGVVLAELLTGKKVLCFDRPENERNLAMFFVSFIKEDRLLEIIDDDIIIQGNVEELKYVASLAKRCLRIKSQERPNMKEVAMELEGVLRSSMEMQEWGKVDGYTGETDYLLTMDSSDLYAIDVSGPMCSQ